MVINCIVIISAIFILGFALVVDFYDLNKHKEIDNTKSVDLNLNPSNFSLARKFLKRLYSDDFEIDTFGNKGFATWGRIIKFYAKDECKCLNIKLEYKSTYLDKGIEIRVLRCVHVYLQDDSLHSDFREDVFDVDFMKSVDSRSDKYVQVKKPYKFVEYIDKNFEKFEKRKQQRLEEEMAKEEQLERENIKRKLACI